MSKQRSLLKTYDRVLLTCGASSPRDIRVPGRDAKGIWFAVDFLGTVTRALLDSDFTKIPYEMARDRHVLVIGGGDTGNDCVGTVIRLGAKSVTQLEMMPKLRLKELLIIRGHSAESSENRLWTGRGHCCLWKGSKSIPDNGYRVYCRQKREYLQGKDSWTAK